MWKKGNRLALFALVLGSLLPGWAFAAGMTGTGDTGIAATGSAAASGDPILYRDDGYTKTIYTSKISVSLDQGGQYGVSLREADGNGTIQDLPVFYNSETSSTSDLIVRIMDGGDTVDREWSSLIDADGTTFTYDSSKNALVQTARYTSPTANVALALSLTIVNGNQMQLSLSAVNQQSGPVAVGYYIYWDLAPHYLDTDGSSRYDDGSPIVFQPNGWQTFIKETAAQAYTINSLFVTPPDHVWAGRYGNAGWDSGLHDEFVPGQSVATSDSAASFWYFPEPLGLGQERFASLLLQVQPQPAATSALQLLSVDSEYGTNTVGADGQWPVTMEVYGNEGATVTPMYRVDNGPDQSMVDETDPAVPAAFTADGYVRQDVTATLSVYGHADGMIPVTVWLQDDQGHSSSPIGLTLQKGPHVEAIYYDNPDSSEYAHKKEGDTVSLFVRFSSPVVVTGSPLLRLNTGRTAVYGGMGASGDTLRFDYIVQRGDNVEQLNVASRSSLILNGGSIRIDDGNGGGANAGLLLPVPYDEGALNDSITVDTTPPMLQWPDPQLRYGYFIPVGSDYYAPDAYATDNFDSGFFPSIESTEGWGSRLWPTVTGEVYTGTPGVYPVHYTVQDSSGNVSDVTLPVVVGPAGSLAAVTSEVGTVSQPSLGQYRLDVSSNAGMFNAYLLTYGPEGDVSVGSVTGVTYERYAGAYNYGLQLHLDTSLGDQTVPVTVTNGVYSQSYMLSVHVNPAPPADLAGPVFAGASYDSTGNSLLLTFSEALSGIIHPEWLTVGIGNGPLLPAQSAGLDPSDAFGRTVRVTPASLPASGDTIRLFLNYGAVRDAAGNPFRPMDPANGIGRAADGTYPVGVPGSGAMLLQKAFLSQNGTEILAFFSSPIGAGSVPAVGAFRIVGLTGNPVVAAKPVSGGPDGRAIRLQLSASLPMTGGFLLQADNGAVQSDTGVSSSLGQAGIILPAFSQLDAGIAGDGIHVDDLIKLSLAQSSPLGNPVFNTTDLLYMLLNIGAYGMQ